MNIIFNLSGYFDKRENWDKVSDQFLKGGFNSCQCIKKYMKNQNKKAINAASFRISVISAKRYDHDKTHLREAKKSHATRPRWRPETAMICATPDLLNGPLSEGVRPCLSPRIRAL